MSGGGRMLPSCVRGVGCGGVGVKGGVLLRAVYFGDGLGLGVSEMFVCCPILFVFGHVFFSVQLAVQYFL